MSDMVIVRYKTRVILMERAALVRSASVSLMMGTLTAAYMVHAITVHLSHLRHWLRVSVVDSTGLDPHDGDMDAVLDNVDPACTCDLLIVCGIRAGSESHYMTCQDEKA